MLLAAIALDKQNCQRMVDDHNVYDHLDALVEFMKDNPLAEKVKDLRKRIKHATHKETFGIH